MFANVRLMLVTLVPLLSDLFSKPFRNKQNRRDRLSRACFRLLDKTLADTDAGESGHVPPACTNYVPDELLVSGNRYLIPVHSA